MPGPNTDRWLRVRYGGPLSGWGYIFGLSWNAASIYLFTPWLGFGVNYEAPVIWAVGPYTKTGIWLGWGRQPVMQGGVRYKHGTEHKLIRYCRELEDLT
jgi:hypothetical protein